MIELFRDKITYFVSDNDLDGITSRLVYHNLIEPVVKSSIILNTANREMEDFNLEDAEKSEIVIFVDIAPTRNLYLKLKELNKIIYIFDHHKTSFDVLNDIVTENYFYTEEKCGAKIFFDELSKGRRCNKTLFQLLELTDHYDRWQEQSLLWKDARNLSNVLYGYVDWSKAKDNPNMHDEFIKQQLYKIENSRYFYFTDKEHELIKKAEQKEKDALKTAKSNLQIRIDNSGNYYGYFECHSKLSYVANQLLKEMEKLKYIICHSTYGDKSGLDPKISIRSIENRNFDCSKLAEIYGGGGHACSAGILFEDLSTFIKLKKGNLHLI